MRFITVAIHTYEKAIALRTLLESEGIAVEFRNVNIENPIVSSGIRVRIPENDLPLALRIIENRDIFSDTQAYSRQGDSTKPILVPVDFSSLSLRAVQVAFILAERHKTDIHLLHTFIDPYVAGNMQLTDSLTYELADSETRRKVESASQTKMDHFCRRLRDMIKTGELPAVRFSGSVVEGVPEDAINEYTKAHNPFIIVMGTRSYRRKERDLIGSVTAEVLDKCRFSVLAVPDRENTVPADRVKLRNILFFSHADQEDILAMDTLHRIFPRSDAKVTIVNLPAKKLAFHSRPKQALEALCKYCGENFPHFSFETHLIEGDNAAVELAGFREAGDFDLLVVPNRKKNIFSRLFSPSLAQKLLFSADIPMLVIPV